MTLPPLSLRGKLFVFAALLVLAPGLLLGVLADRSARDSLQRVIGRQLESEARHTADRLSVLLRSERSTLQSFAHQDLMREVRVADLDKRIAQALSTLRDGSPVRLDYVVVDARGRPVAASSPERLRDTESASSLARVGTEYTRPMRLGAATTLAIATPIPDPDGGAEALGSLVGLLDWSHLTRVLEGVREDLASRDIVASLRIVDEGDRALGVVGPVAEVDFPVTEGAGFAVDEAANGWIVGWAPLDPEVAPWRLLVYQPLAHALAPARALTRRLAVTMAVALAAALVLATLSARRVVRPLSELTDAIRGMAGGDFGGARVPVRSDDEVGVLARSFNQMASDLERAQRDLVEAEKFAFVGELASGVAHEVRTSLGVLRSSAQMLEQAIARAPEPQVPELVDMIRDEVGRLSRVVDDLLTLDRPRALHLERTPLSAPLCRAADFVEPQAAEKRVKVSVHRAEADPVVCCDREALQHVCVNLLVNSVQCLEPGGRIDLEIGLRRGASAGFRVSDDGPGVPEELRARIFEPFMTGRDTGVGLGLTFVKRVVHEHGGRISVGDSESGGACFEVWLPLAAEDA